MTGWRKRTIMEMAREAGFSDTNGVVHAAYQLEAFAKQVRADERDKWMERTVILIRGEREACAKVCENLDFEPDGEGWTDGVEMCIQAIRARSNK